MTFKQYYTSVLVGLSIFLGCFYFFSEIGEIFKSIFLLLAGVFFYFIPSLVGADKKFNSSIFVLNLFLGWTFIGWVAALVWAVGSSKKTISWLFINLHHTHTRDTRRIQNSTATSRLVLPIQRRPRGLATWRTRIGNTELSSQRRHWRFQASIQLCVWFALQQFIVRDRKKSIYSTISFSFSLTNK